MRVSDSEAEEAWDVQWIQVGEAANQKGSRLSFFVQMSRANLNRVVAQIQVSEDDIVPVVVRDVIDRGS